MAEMISIVSCFKGHKDSVTCLDIHPTLDLIVSGSEDGTVRFWDLETKKAVRCFVVGIPVRYFIIIIFDLFECECN